MVEDFYSLYGAEGAKYSDPEFTPDTSSLYWADMGEAILPDGTEGNLKSKEDRIVWKRAGSIYSKRRESLFGRNGVTVHDV